MLTACLAPRAADALNERSQLSANPNAEVRISFRDTSGLDCIGKVMHEPVDSYPPLASRADRLFPLQRECFAIKVCAGVWGAAAAHVRAIREKEDGRWRANQIGALVTP